MTYRFTSHISSADILPILNAFGCSSGQSGTLTRMTKEGIPYVPLAGSKALGLLRSLAEKYSDYGTDQADKDTLVKNAMMSPLCSFSGKEKGKLSLRPNFATVFQALHPYILMSLIVRITRAKDVNAAVLDPAAYGKTTAATRMPKIKTSHVFGWPASLDTDDLREGVLELLMKAREQQLCIAASASATPIVINQPASEPATTTQEPSIMEQFNRLTVASKAIVFGKTLTALQDEAAAKRCFDSIIGDGTAEALATTLRMNEALLDRVNVSDTKLDGVVEQVLRTFRIGPPDSTGQLADWMGDVEEQAAPVTASPTVTSPTVTFDPSLVPAIDSLIKQASKGEYGSFEHAVRQVEEEREAMAQRYLNLEQASKGMAQEIAQLKARPVVASIEPAYHGQVEDLTWTVEMKPASALLKAATGKALQHSFMDVELPVFTWKDKAGNVVRHPECEAVDPFYVWQPVVLETLIFGQSGGRVVALVGDTGTGKSTAALQFNAVLGRPVVRVNLDADISRMDLIGRDTLVNGVSRFVDGPIPRGLSGPYTLLMDEIDFARPEIIYVAQRVLEGQGVAIIEDGNRIVRQHDWCRIVTTSNTKGQGDERRVYAGARMLSLATLDRFAAWCEGRLPEGAA